jgi:hypothetical protein
MRTYIRATFKILGLLFVVASIFAVNLAIIDSVTDTTARDLDLVVANTFIVLVIVPAWGLLARKKVTKIIGVVSGLLLASGAIVYLHFLCDWTKIEQVALMLMIDVCIIMMFNLPNDGH